MEFTVGDPTPADDKAPAEIRGGDRPSDYLPKKYQGKPDFEVGLDDEDEDEDQ